ncbi:hypothetical protein PCL1606_06830 [Pseudomonas chlororaphis]|uniref:Uncharacterized protein n=1 Tax=Pseudomonas chlororaphis TaxID=587753 RepID=A0A0D5XSU9_9PSED|nr:hypothetical protein PCL1606_06830 [Pseudomonas chlororaphis]
MRLQGAKRERAPLRIVFMSVVLHIAIRLRCLSNAYQHKVWMPG